MTGRDLAHLLLDLDMSQTALARDFGVARMTVRRWIKGIHPVPPRVAAWAALERARLQSGRDSMAE